MLTSKWTISLIVCCGRKLVLVPLWKQAESGWLFKWFNLVCWLSVGICKFVSAHRLYFMCGKQTCSLQEYMTACKGEHSKSISF